MRCSYCGYEIPEGKLSCDNCGKEIFIVPDYNPLDDMLAEQVKVSVNGGGEREELNISQNTRNKTSARRNTRNTGSTRNTKNIRNQKNTARERQRRQAEKRKAMRRKKRRRLIVVILILLAAAAGFGILLYQNSYKGIVNKGYQAIKAQEYEKAAEYFQKAIAKKGDRAEAYTGLSKVYLEQNVADQAKELFEQAIRKYSKNADIYEAYIQFLLTEDEVMQIPLLLDGADDSVKEALADYMVDEPEFDLDEKKIYDDVQQLTISAGGNKIYFTTDESSPSPQGQKYAEPIQLAEGENVIQAIAVNKKGIPSMTVKKTYVIEFPVIDPPAVSPSTGQYESEQEIEIKVPDGYEAYYTLDGEEPTTASEKYTGPVQMPEGETLFKAILVNAKGRVSGVTTRNYQLYTDSAAEPSDEPADEPSEE